jgi:hypothetical protein
VPPQHPLPRPSLFSSSTSLSLSFRGSSYRMDGCQTRKGIHSQHPIPITEGKILLPALRTPAAEASTCLGDSKRGSRTRQCSSADSQKEHSASGLRQTCQGRFAEESVERRGEIKTGARLRACVVSLCISVSVSLRVCVCDESERKARRV